MLSVAIALLSGLIWGVGDFAGGKATQRAAALPVVWLSKLVSLPLLAIYLIAMWVPVTPIGLVWGALAGIASVIGLVLPYATGIAPILTPAAAIGLGMIMVAAAVIHLRLQEPWTAAGNVILLALCVLVAIGRWP